MKKLFTVIICTSNRAELLKQTLKSLSSQTFKDFEAFIVDDGSTDHTLKIFREFKDWKNWNFIKLEKNRGQAFARNYAIEKASGKYITFLDSDDIWLPKRLESFANLIKENEKAGFIFSNAYMMRNNIITDKFFKETTQIPKGKLEPYMAISNKYLPYVTTNVAIKMEALEKVGKFREDMHFLEDMELYVRILKYFEADYIKTPLAIYRIHNVTKTLKSLTLNWEHGIEDFYIALTTANPPEKIKLELKNHIHTNQAIIYIKNMSPEQARKHLYLTSTRNLKFYFYIILTFIPIFLISLMKKIYIFKRHILNPKYNTSTNTFK